MNEASSCWCGNTNMVAFSPEYLRCSVCETLVTRQMPESGALYVNDDERDFYGHNYWFSHQERKLAQPNILDRSRTDLPERGVYWLRDILKYKLPPGRGLEIGSGHGGFVAMLGWAGFDATGLELSPWVVDFARKTFGVPILLGPVEQQQIELGSLDLIALMDVLEHLRDPLETMRYCLSLLKPNGILAIQTPCYPEGKTYGEMVAETDRFLEQLKFNEHLYLFSPRSIQEFFHRLGADYLAFEPAIFSHYDMFLFVSRVPLVRLLPGEIERALGTTSSGRLIQALLDLDDQFQNVMNRYGELETCAAERLENGRRLEQLLAESETDRAARLENVFKLQKLLEESERDRAARSNNIHQLERLLEESERDRAARLDVIRAQESELDRLQAEVKRSLEEARELKSRLASVEEELSVQRTQAAMWASHAYRLQEIFQITRRSRAYRILRRLGRWKFMERPLDDMTGTQLSDPKPELETQSPSTDARALDVKLRHIAVDLTPLLPGAENGGAKLVAIELVRHLSKLRPDCEFVLLTTEENHDELAYLEGSNVRRKCVAHQLQNEVRPPSHLRIRAQEILARILPASLFVRLKSLYRSFQSLQGPKGTLRAIKADLLFCPFTAPSFYKPSMATVCVVHDLQHRYYPQFFAAEERSHRDRYFKEVCSLATRIVCVSEYVRQTVLANSQLNPNHVVTIPTRLFSRLERQGAETISEVLKRWALLENEFLLYPANFWPHKNHWMLFTAFGIYGRRHPQSKLQLVCTGAPDANMKTLLDAAERMGLTNKIVFPEYLPDNQFVALLQACKAIIFPSLYEGFGMPILEAMEFGKPVLCSNLTSLQEVGGCAPLYLDPRKPQDIVVAIERITSDDELVADMVRRGQKHLASLSGPEKMAEQYLEVFRQALSSSRRFVPTLEGVYPDGWTGERIVVTYGAEAGRRYLETSLHVPSWIPHDHIYVTPRPKGTGRSQPRRVGRGESLTIRELLPNTDGIFEILMTPTFQPKATGMNDDDRVLGCQCLSCSVVSQTKNYDLFKELTR